MAYYRGTYRGDYYRRGRGDYYMGGLRRPSGDPFWAAILRGITTVGRAVLGIPSAAATGATAATVTAGAGRTAAATAAIARRVPAAIGAVLPSRQIPGMIAGATGTTMVRRVSARIAALLATGAAIEVGGKIIDAITGQEIRTRSRRMNPANVKALRRSIRRVVGFGKLCAQARSSVGKAATQLQYGRGRRTTVGTTAMARASARR